MSDTALLAILIFAGAALYSSVGHGGASGYLAAMALIGLAPEVMRPTALVLNILVSTIGTARFAAAGHFSWAVLWPFLVGAIPLAFLGGALQLPGALYRPLVGLVLLFAAFRLLLERLFRPVEPRSLAILPAVLAGATIGLLSGLTGIGGGIFLSPLLLLTGWAAMRLTAGVTAPFILMVSSAGLAGNLASFRFLPEGLLVWAPAAALGGFLGAELGSRRLATSVMRRLLAVVLVLAGLKLILT